MICLYYRWRISNAVDSLDPGALLPRKHLARCPSCRRFHDNSLQLAAALREPAQVRRLAPADSLSLRRTWRNRAVAVSLATAASLAFAFWLRPVPDLSSNRPGPVAPMIASQRHPVGQSPVSAQNLLQQVGSPLLSLGEPATQPIVDQIEQTRRQFVAVGRDMVACLPTGFLSQQ